MKLIGKILLIIGSLLFLVSGAYSCYSSIASVIKTMPIDVNAWVTFGVSLACGLISLLAGIGGFCFAVGAGPFRGLVRPFAVIILILWIIIIVFDAIAFGNKEIELKEFLINLLGVGVPEICYVLGYFWSRR